MAGTSIDDVVLAWGLRQAAPKTSYDEAKRALINGRTNEQVIAAAGASGWNEAIISLASTPAVLASDAVLWLDPQFSVSGEQVAVNQGTGGSALDATYGSTGGADTNDPLLLTHTGSNYVYFPGTAGNSLTASGFTIPSTEGVLSLPFTDGALTILASDITDAGATSFTASTGQTVTVNRSTTGPKTTLVTRPVWLFGTDDFLEVADNDLLDFGADQDFTVMAIMRQFANPTSFGVIADKSTGLVSGWSFQSKSDYRLYSEVDDGTNQAASNGATDATAAGRLSVRYMAVDRTADTLVTGTDGSESATVSVASVGSLASAVPMRIGRYATSGNFMDMELVALAVWDRVLTSDELAEILAYYGAGEPATVTTTTLDAMTQGNAFSQTLAATGITPITWSVTAGTIPAGLTLSSAGVLSGIPTVSGAYDFTVTATNSGGSDTQQYTGTIAASGGSDPSYFTGGIVTVEDHGGTDYRVHTFNTSGTLTFVDVSGAIDVDYLVVAGGGAGGNGKAGGGGAGEYLTATSYALGATTTITVGAGGAVAGGSLDSGGDGSNSSLGAITVADGGGGGGGGGKVGTAGGSGGGGGGGTVQAGGAATGTGGNAGGEGINQGDIDPGGGGGGASEVGADAVSDFGGSGGDGLTWLDGNTYAGGGGGSVSTNDTTPGPGGSGGGGIGAILDTADSGDGTLNTGGGGGGGATSGSTYDLGGAGGSGVVKIRYVDHPSYPAGSSTSAWFDASDSTTITETTGDITAWDDVYGRFSLTGNAAYTAPRYGDDTINGLDVVTFTAGHLWNDSTGTLLGTDGDYTAFAVTADTATNDNVASSDKTSGSRGPLYFRTQSTDWLTQRVTTTSNTTDVVQVSVGTRTAAPTVLAARLSPSDNELAHWQEGGTPVTATVGSLGAWDDQRLAIGGRPTLTVSDQLNGQVAEFMLFPRALTTAEMNTVGNYLADKWGLTWTDI